MNRLEEAKTYARAFKCESLPGDQVSLETFVKRAKEDWNLRGQHDPSLYVCASHNASEAQIRASGAGDVAREFLPRVLDYPHENVLEIGCGFGRMTRSIAEYAKNVWGIDISPSLIQIAKDRNADLFNVHFVEGDGMTLNGVPDGLFDVAFEYIVFQHTIKPIVLSYISEVWKKLKIGGVFVLHGRDVPCPGVDENPNLGNTWHGTRLGPELIREALRTTAFSILKEEGQNTDRYWATLRKHETTSGTNR